MTSRPAASGDVTSRGAAAVTSRGAAQSAKPPPREGSFGGRIPARASPGLLTSPGLQSPAPPSLSLRGRRYSPLPAAVCTGRRHQGFVWEGATASGLPSGLRPPAGPGDRRSGTGGGRGRGSLPRRAAQAALTAADAWCVRRGGPSPLSRQVPGGSVVP